MPSARHPQLSIKQILAGASNRHTRQNTSKPHRGDLISDRKQSNGAKGRCPEPSFKKVWVVNCLRGEETIQVAGMV